MPKSGHAAPLCQHLDALVDDLRALVPQALQEFDEKAIHHARVTTRRLKAALDLLESVLNADHSGPFARVGKKLRRRLGPLRDIDVMLGHLDELREHRRLGPAVEWLQARLMQERQLARNESQKRAAPSPVLAKLGTWWAMRQDVLDAAPKIPQLIDQSLRDQLADFTARADQVIAKAPAPSDGAAPRQDPHELRIAGKRLRYTLELAQVNGVKIPAAILRTFKRMQGLLGLWHDHVVLAERAMQASLEEDLPLHDPPMQKQVLNLVNFALTRAQREMDQFGKLWSRRGEQLAADIRGAVGAISESKTDPDPHGSEPASAPAASHPASPPAA